MLGCFFNGLLSHFNNFLKNDSYNLLLKFVINMELTPNGENTNHFKAHLLISRLRLQAKSRMSTSLRNIICGSSVALVP